MKRRETCVVKMILVKDVKAIRPLLSKKVCWNEGEGGILQPNRDGRMGVLEELQEARRCRSRIKKWA